ncbi:VapC toxin family PIN domain ribonuclease [Halobacteriales archaeon SW_5_70_135]|nr:MAG: VapC toxin family PIN domain ribonuclease [Halobacteriales archaeon SW_5_70_135]
MKVLDSSFLVDYERGDPGAATFLQDDSDEEFVVPATVYTEYLLGEANAAPEPDLAAVHAEVDWTRAWPVTEETAGLGVAAVAEPPASAPHPDGVDATVVGVVREADAPVVAGESDVTHDAVRDRLNVELYRTQSRARTIPDGCLSHLRRRRRRPFPVV